MGVCMGKDTSAITSDLLDPDGRFVSSKGADGSGGGVGSTKLNNNDGMRNGGVGGDEKISPPRTPIIFVLGGPGSGKITHCDRVVQESLIPPSNLIEVLQMEIKMAVNARGYLISGYPRSMRDVVEYQNKLQRIDAVILLNWHIRILEKQIEYGSQLGDTVLQLARMELKNYSKNVLSVAEYFDQLDKLTVVDGERQPTEVYDDFLAAVDASLAAIPAGGYNKGGGAGNKRQNGVGGKSLISGADSLLSSTSVRLHHSGRWEWISVGDELRNIVAVAGGSTSNGHAGGKSHQTKNHQVPNFLSPDQIVAVRNALVKGELVRDDIVLALIRDAMSKAKSKKCFVLDGFPRTLKQVEGFRDMIDGDLEDKGRIVEEFNETLGSIIDSYDDDRDEQNKRTNNRLGVAPLEKRKPSTDTINGMYNEVQQNSE
ncbi:Adenylate kinase isoenzyme 5 [Folsomia candida]|uniref:Adenylate kinase isoenzyme 5 n=1 Tax=Folsomia candida TaxID=158441 RepID=A0A226E185_FOLCA|nr:Adenylate kinase isoenzyme 5 [Folsomia candida]